MPEALTLVTHTHWMVTPWFYTYTAPVSKVAAKTHLLPICVLDDTTTHDLRAGYIVMSEKL